MRIAIVGSGVSGLVAAHMLHARHDITVFEADNRIGGHTHTWRVQSDGREHAVDSGFIVFNERNYPNFTRLLGALGVPSQPTTMSFSMRHDAAQLEYNGSTLSQLFVQRRSIIRPAFLSMIRDIVLFNRNALTHLLEKPECSVGELLEDGAYSAAFRDWYLLPMASALWSIPRALVRDMPARYVIDFLDNHGMLSMDGRPQWRVVQGGSARYVDALTAPFRNLIRTRTRVQRVERFADRVEVNGEMFDRVVFACHSDQALAALAAPTTAERRVLGALPYQVNDALLHTDTSVLPRSQAAWGAWNYRIDERDTGAATVTYNMNALQSLDARETFCVTLNDRDWIDPARMIGEVRYAHPVATLEGEAARAQRGVISGVHRTHYCGAYWGNGFHEAGVSSGIAVAAEIAHAEIVTMQDMLVLR